MRDKLGNFGNISLATKDVDVYSADSLNMNALDSRLAFSEHQTGLDDGLVIVFRPATDFSSVDGIIPFIQEDDNSGFSSPVTILTGVEVTAPKAGDPIVLPVPAKHKQYLRAGATPKSSGTFTAETVAAYLEHGVNPQ